MVALRLRAKQWFLGSVKFFGLEHRTLAFPQFKFNIFSTGGVDGVLNSMVEKLEGIPRVFVDLGANDPIVGSNSALWIERGWEALLVEAYPPAFESLQDVYRDRPKVVLSDLAVSADRAATETQINWHGHFENLSVPARWVNHILQLSPDEKIGILKVDLDGMDDEVLAALDFELFRPWVVVAEIDSSSKENLDRQLNIMWTHGYVCVLHIGNVFYVARERIASYLYQSRQAPMRHREVLTRRNG